MLPHDSRTKTRSILGYPLVNRYKYLGVILQSTMSFSLDLDHKKSRTDLAFKAIDSTLNSLANPGLKKTVA